MVLLAGAGHARIVAHWWIWLTLRNPQNDPSMMIVTASSTLQKYPAYSFAVPSVVK